tara:strand:- start:2237 stop:3877 length:1641 start_codon:yes stop_codon:yes gene_type:complete
MSDIVGIFNTSAYDGTIDTDFLNIGNLSLDSKASNIDYSVDDFKEYRAAMISYVKAVYPDDYNNFADSDLGVMLVELFAYLASVLSFKADMIANESFISSVKTTENLRKLLQLIGIALKGPVSAKAGATLSLNSADALDDLNDSITINESNRSFSVDTNKDTGSLTYTLYKVSDNGSIELTTPNISLPKYESLNKAGVVFSNLILLEGQLKSQSGIFNSVNTLHSVQITNAPIVEGSLYAVVDGVVYNEVQNLFLAGADDTVFSKTYTGNYAATLVFGDNIRGKSPSPGASYQCFYRIGGGTRGNVSPGTIKFSLPATKISAIDSKSIDISTTIENPTKATGGRNAESIAHARKWGPNFFKTQYRAVTGEDYTSFANQFVSTVGQSGKSIAALRSSGAGSNMIDIYTVAFADEVDGVQAQLERAPITYKSELLKYLNNYKMLTDEVTIVDGLIRTLDVKATIYIDKVYQPFEEDIKRAASLKILQFFDLSKREFGEVVRSDELNREIFSVPEVRFSKINNLRTDDIKLNFNEILQLNNIELNVALV